MDAQHQLTSCLRNLECLYENELEPHSWGRSPSPAMCGRTDRPQNGKPWFLPAYFSETRTRQGDRVACTLLLNTGWDEIDTHSCYERACSTIILIQFGASCHKTCRSKPSIRLYGPKNLIARFLWGQIKAAMEWSYYPLLRIIRESECCSPEQPRKSALPEPDYQPLFLRL